MHSSISQRYSPRAEADLGQGEAAARLIGLISMWLVILPVVPIYAGGAWVSRAVRRRLVRRA
jgi:hypothetical protein